MVTGGRDDDARSCPPACQPATRGEGDASSSGVAGRVPMTDTSAEVEVVAKNGRRVKLNGPIEVTWSHGEPYPHPHGAGFMCFYCFKKVRGGGVTRLKEHLAGATGNVAECPNVPAYIKDLMSSEVVKGKVRRKRSNDIRLFVEKEVMAANIGYGRPRNALDEATQVETAMRESLRGSNSALENGSSSPFGRPSGSGAASCSGYRQTRIDRFYQSPQSASNAPFDIDLARCRAQAQPRVDVMLMGGSKEKIGKAWAKFFHANDIPGRKADCPYFRSALKLSQQLGEGVQIPTGREIDSPLLDMNFQDVEVYMRQFKEDWHEYGVTIMCDSWTGPTLMSIINFMVYCNGRMFFLKSVNATGLIQNADYIHSILREVVHDEVGDNCVVQIVTDNGANYKKACRMIIAEFTHITWQPCAAHTINLMLKDIATYLDVEYVVDSAKRICRFLYKHNRVHAMMREKIGGELIRWNATRFGTVFIFLQSFWDRQDKFKQWMISDDWESCKTANEEEHDYAYNCLTSKRWWSDMELVLKAVSPLYSVLRFADQQKGASIFGFLPKMLSSIDDIHGNLSHNPDPRHKLMLDKLMEVIKVRLQYLVNGNLMIAAAALNPKALYTHKLARRTTYRHAVTLAFRKLASSSSKASAAIDQYTIFSKLGGLFGGEEARRSALSGKMSPADWWDQYGGDCKELQELARRIVSQCMSSSGCERNWSTFALVHTKLRNRLNYEKLHKLVFVHYNLKLRIQQFEAEMQSLHQMQSTEQEDFDPCSILMEIALYDEGNPIMDWLCNSGSESVPTLDEYDGSEPESPNSPSTFLVEELGMNEEELATIKKKLDFGKKKVVPEEDIADDFESDYDQQGSPTYAESRDSSSDDSEGDGDAGGSCGNTGGVGQPSRGEESNGGQAGAKDVQPAPLRPRSKRLKKVSVKGLYGK